MAQLRSWSTNKYRFGTFLFILLFPLLITGCNPDSGLMEYEIEYPSGHVVTAMTDFSELTPIEGSQLQIYTKHIKGANHILYIQDADGKTLYTANVVEGINRGQMVNGALWICAERWTSVHMKQFLDTRLKTGAIYRIDINSGEITFNEKLGMNEIFLTMNGERCYFYHRGKESEDKLFGLVTTSSQNAEIYYRDISSWKQKHPVYTFNYAGVPPEAAVHKLGSVRYTLSFSVQTDKIEVTQYSYEMSDGEWRNVPVWSIDTAYD